MINAMVARRKKFKKVYSLIDLDIFFSTFMIFTIVDSVYFSEGIEHGV